MIKIIFTISRETFRIVIVNKEIWYNDRRWNREVRLIPTDKHFVRKIKMSRNKIPAQLIEWFSLTKEEQKQYDNAKTEKELMDICIQDARRKGARVLDIISTKN